MSVFKSGVPFSDQWKLRLTEITKATICTGTTPRGRDSLTRCRWEVVWWAVSPPPPFRSTIWHHISPSPSETPPGGNGLIWLSLSHKGKVGRRWIPSPDLTPGICLSNRGPDSRAENENNESATLARTHLRGSCTRTGSCRPGRWAVLGTVEGTTTTVLPPCSEHVTQSFLWLWIKLWRSRRDVFTVFL